MYPESLSNLIDSLNNLPGIGKKTAERLAFSMIDFDSQDLTSFAEAILSVRDNIKRCEICNNISDNNICHICSNQNRDSKIIFVVEKSKDILLFEKIGTYNGVYHVLEKLISPIDGINPDDLNLNLLIERIDKNKVSEVILALKPNIEGETTMQYIKRILEKKNIKVTKIATGIPMGTDIEYIDSMTLEMALDQRKDF